MCKCCKICHFFAVFLLTRRDGWCCCYFVFVFSVFFPSLTFVVFFLVFFRAMHSTSRRLFFISPLRGGPPSSRAPNCSTKFDVVSSPHFSSRNFSADRGPKPFGNRSNNERGDLRRNFRCHFQPSVLPVLCIRPSSTSTGDKPLLKELEDSVASEQEASRLSFEACKHI